MAQLLRTSKGDITIRIATPDDTASLLKLRLESLTLHPESFAADVDQTAADGEEAWAKLVTDYATARSGAMLIACAGAQLIGMAGIVRGHWPKTHHVGTLWGVYVKPDWRGFHIGGAIVNEIIEWAINNEMTVLYLGVTVSALSAIRCYTRCGFKEYGIEPKVIFYNGIYYDQVLMVRLL